MGNLYGVEFEETAGPNIVGALEANLELGLTAVTIHCRAIITDENENPINNAENLCTNLISGNKTFASKYNLEFLVFYEKFTWVQEAIAREKELKKWRREKKLNLIREFNPTFEFLNYHFDDFLR